jgi:hypothetical protein
LFSTWTFCKNILMVFLNSPCRETPKNVLRKKSQEKKSRMVGRWVWDLANVRGVRRFCFAGPSTTMVETRAHGPAPTCGRPTQANRGGRIAVFQIGAKSRTWSKKLEEKNPRHFFSQNRQAASGAC